MQFVGRIGAEGVIRHLGYRASCEMAGNPDIDHENRKVPISNPAANAQRPSVQVETTRTRLRRSSSDAISWDRSVIAAAPPWQQLPGPSFMDGRHPGDPATHSN
jgi:hypothetical protein